jgi:hypothetical protein
MADLGRIMVKFEERLAKVEKILILLAEKEGIDLDEAMPFTRPQTRAELKQAMAELKEASKAEEEIAEEPEDAPEPDEAEETDEAESVDEPEDTESPSD